MSGLNDPRVLFASERTLLAWSRTSISLMVFGFVIERFGIFLEVIRKQELEIFQRHASFFIGESFVLLAVFIAFFSILQHRRVIRTINPEVIPEGYNSSGVMIVNTIVGVFGLVLSLYLTFQFQSV